MSKLKLEINTDRLFFSSDLHLFHRNIISYCNRPFSNMETMNESLINNWNATVDPEDIIFVLGDFMYTNSVKSVQNIVNRLNGTIYLIYGNHDYQHKFDRKAIRDIFENRCYDNLLLVLKDEEIEGGIVRLFLSHFPHLSWFSGAYHLHGHLHTGELSTKKSAPYHPMRYDVGVDNNNFSPISYEELLIIFTKRMLKKDLI